LKISKLNVLPLRLLHYVMMLLALPVLGAGSAPLVWNPSVDSNVIGYKIYYGVASNVYIYSVDVGNVTNAVISGLTENIAYYFAAKSYDVFGNESVFSGETNVMVYPTTAATLAPGACASGQFTMFVSGVTNYEYVVQTSTNLMDWVAVQTNTAPFTFVDSNASQFSQRFYRTVSLQ
jgi:hypothetical protein